VGFVSGKNRFSNKRGLSATAWGADEELENPSITAVV
jgi:hypothetical protein